MILKNEYLFGYATNMKERIEILDTTAANQSLENLKKWKNRKTLLSDSDFRRMLTLRNISETQYDLAVSPLNEISLKKLFSYVKQQEWFKLHKKIFSIQRTYTPKSIKAALHFHVNFYMDFISELSTKYHEITFDDSCLNSMKKDITAQLMNLAQKTLVWDVHAKLENTPNSSNLSDSESFKYYLTKRFGDNLTEYFFLEYPTLARLLAERMVYAMENLQLIIDSLKNCTQEITLIFGIKTPFCISKFQSQKGDFHNKGKASTIIEINHVPLVYKFRNNDVLKKYNTLLSFIEKSQPNFHLYKSRHITGKGFCIEEFIDNENCTNSSEIIEYYKNYGYLSALTYWLGSTDLHKENLIAKGKHPVLIDVETLLRTEERRIYSDDFTKIKYFESNSAISTGMLPMEKYWKKQIDYSALNGMKQKLPYKVRKLLNEDTSKIAFELCESYTLPANNIPRLNGERITYENYSHYIETSFEKMLFWLQKNGNVVYQHILEDFNSIAIRVILRDTQDYYNFLDFSTHPSCMVDYIEREKIFENLWSNSFIDSNIVLYEVAALCRHDIPYFFTSTNSKDIYSCDGKIENYFSQNILNLLKKHITSIDKYNIEYSLLLLGESLNCLSSKCKPISIPSCKTNKNIFIDKANNIADIMLKNIIINEKENTVLWPEPMNHGKKLTVDYPDSNLYNGTSGLFIFFYHLNELSPNPKYKKILQVLEYEIFNAEHFSDFESAFYGKGSKIAASFIAYHLKKEEKYYNHLTKWLLETKKIASKIKSWDWIRGKSSLITLLVTIYTECPLPIIENILEILISDIDCIDIKGIGFAHGYCGILYALLRVNTVLHHANINKKIIEIYQIIENRLQKHNTFSPAWCNGTLGINQALSEFAKQHPTYNIKLIEPKKYYIQNNSCICHGTFGEVSTDYNMLDKSSKIYRNNLVKYAHKEIILCQYKRFIPLGLFNGLSGIGYQLLYCAYPNKIVNLLFFNT